MKDGGFALASWCCVPGGARVTMCAVIACFCLCIGCSGAEVKKGGSKSGDDFAGEVIEVADAQALIQAIGPNRLIRLKPGDYYLPDILHGAWEYVEWELVSDISMPRHEIVIRDVNNLRIESDPEKKARLWITAETATVLTFKNTSNVVLSGLELGHDLEMELVCPGDVLRVENSENFVISDSVLYGSGQTGIELDNVNNFSATNTVIRDCSYSLMSASGSRNLHFSDCRFISTGKYDGGGELVSLWSVSEVLFERCEFSGNRTSDYSDEALFYLDSTTNVQVRESNIHHNSLNYLVFPVGALNLDGNLIEHNSVISE